MANLNVSGSNYTIEKDSTLWAVAKAICKKDNNTVTNTQIVSEMARLAKINGCKDYDELGDKFKKIGTQLKIAQNHKPTKDVEHKTAHKEAKTATNPKVSLELPKLHPVKNLVLNSKVVKKAEEILSQDINEGNGKNISVSQGRNEAWCANTVNYVYEKAYGKSPFGLHKNGTYKASVSELKQWGVNNGRFKPANGEEQVKSQLKTVKPGDVIIWKSAYKCKVAGMGLVTKQASHTGIVESVSKDGTVSIIEGNANKLKKNAKGECLLVKSKQDGINGNQEIGELQEVNRHDAMLRKQYSAKDLVSSGYSGYLNMQDLKM